jgi:hypothetical protein
MARKHTSWFCGVVILLAMAGLFGTAGPACAHGCGFEPVSQETLRLMQAMREASRSDNSVRPPPSWAERILFGWPNFWQTLQSSVAVKPCERCPLGGSPHQPARRCDGPHCSQSPAPAAAPVPTVEYREPESAVPIGESSNAADSQPMAAREESMPCSTSPLSIFHPPRPI